MTLLDMLLYFLVVAYLVADLVVIVLWLIPSYAVSVSAHLFISCSLPSLSHLGHFILTEK